MADAKIYAKASRGGSWQSSPAGRLYAIVRGRDGFDAEKNDWGALDERVRVSKGSDVYRKSVGLYSLQSDGMMFKRLLLPNEYLTVLEGAAEQRLVTEFSSPLKSVFMADGIFWMREHDILSATVPVQGLDE